MYFALGSEAGSGRPSLARWMRMDRAAQYMSGSAAAVGQDYTLAAAVVLVPADSHNCCRLCWRPAVVQMHSRVETAYPFAVAVSLRGHTLTGPTHTAVVAAVADIDLAVVSGMV